MFDDTQTWIRENPQLSLWIIVFLIVVIIILLYLIFTKKDSMRVGIDGRDINRDGMDTNLTANRLLAPGLGGGANILQDTSQSGGGGGKMRRTLYQTDGFKADVDRPNFWEIDPALREEQIASTIQSEGMVNNTTGVPGTDEMAGLLY